MDFVETFLDYTRDQPSPEIFRTWAGISCVAGALERRVSVQVYPRPTYANLFVALVANPGIGKGVIEDTAFLWRAAKAQDGKTAAFRIAPDSVTSAALLLALKDAARVVVRDGAIASEYAALQVATEELGVMIPAHDLEFLSRLNYIFTNPPSLRVFRVYQKEIIEIVHPQLNILAGTQPGFLASTLPDEAWSMGFTARLILIHSDTSAKTTLFSESAPRQRSESALIEHLSALSTLDGTMKWEPQAAQLLVNWDAGGRNPVPEHSRLLHYCNRRTQYVIKLSMISSASRGPSMVIVHDDVVRALDWLLLAEQSMPDIFRAMVAKSDAQVMRELHFFMWREQARTKQKPIHETALFNFLSDRVPSEKISRILESMTRSNMLIRIAGTQMYLAQPTNKFGVE